MESQNRTSTLTASDSGWLVSAAFDLAFVANVGWLLLLLPFATTDSDTVISFWQVYFVTLPHRWITLVLVALDPDRRAGRSRVLVGTAIIALVIVVGVYFGTGGLTCLAIVDFVWNSWHFGSQHAGILRMYSLKAGAGPSRIERWGLRLFVCYVLLRTATWTTGWTLGTATLEGSRRVVDLIAFLLPAAVIGSTFVNGRLMLGRVVYLLSVTALYGGLLLAIVSEAEAYVLPLTVASAVFHASEYLAIVTLYANRRKVIGSPGRFRMLATNWPTFLLIYLIGLGTLGVVLEGMSPAWAELWLAINVWAALVHYAFDGMIWKLRTASTAQALGAVARVRL